MLRVLRQADMVFAAGRAEWARVIFSTIDSTRGYRLGAVDPDTARAQDADRWLRSDQFLAERLSFVGEPLQGRGDSEIGELPVGGFWTMWSAAATREYEVVL
jgi:hypothetical protein